MKKWNLVKVRKSFKLVLSVLIISFLLLVSSISVYLFSVFRDFESNTSTSFKGLLYSINDVVEGSTDVLESPRVEQIMKKVNDSFEFQVAKRSEYRPLLYVTDSIQQMDHVLFDREDKLQYKDFDYKVAKRFFTDDFLAKHGDSLQNIFNKLTIYDGYKIKSFRPSSYFVDGEDLYMQYDLYHDEKDNKDLISSSFVVKIDDYKKNKSRFDEKVISDISFVNETLKDIEFPMFKYNRNVMGYLLF